MLQYGELLHPGITGQKHPLRLALVRAYSLDIVVTVIKQPGQYSKTIFYANTRLR